MKARVKATGEIVHVTYIGNGKYVTDRPNDYHRYDYEEIEELPDDYDCVQHTPDYWTRLEHQYAGMAMQGILSNPESELDYKDNEALPQAIAACAAKIAHALVEKMKEERK